MKKILECIPNFSEGQDQGKIRAITEAIKGIPHVCILNTSSDTSHNRTVVTFAGDPEAVLEAAFQAIKKAAELIDLNHHNGVHPRMGATDVCPLVPIQGIAPDEALEYATLLAKRVASELSIPIYLYEKSALTPAKQNLADLRRGGYETIKEEIDKDPKRYPDFGPKKIGPAGITAIGIRDPLIAYNVNLNTSNLEIARKIAKKIRGKNGGFKYVKALGLMLTNRNIAQVSMNIVNHKETALYEVFEAIQQEAQHYGVDVLESEIIGLIPEESLIETAKHYLKLANDENSQVLEVELRKALSGKPI